MYCYEVANNGQAMPKASTKHEAPVLCSSWSSDGASVFTGGCDNIAKKWDLASGQATQIAQHDGPIRHMAWIEQVGLLVTGSWDRTLKYWDTRQPNPALQVQLPERCYALDVTHPLLVVGCAERQIQIFNLSNPQVPYKQLLSPLKYQTRCVATFPDRSGYLVGSIEGRVAVQHVEDNLQSKNFTFKCHREGTQDIYAVNSISFHPTFGTFVTAGADGQVKVWDVRTFKPLHQYFSSAPAVALDVSQRGMLAVGWGRRVQVWQGALARKAKAPYLNHSFDEGCTLGGFAFCPYEDVLVAGHARGVSSMMVPGAGEPNYDSYVANPFQTRKERIGMVRRDTAEAADERRTEAQAANDAALRSQRAENAEKSRKKGKNKASRRHRKKQVNVIVDRRDETAKKLKESGQRLAEKRRAEVPEGLPKALERFY